MMFYCWQMLGWINWMSLQYLPQTPTVVQCSVNVSLPLNGQGVYEDSQKVVRPPTGRRQLDYHTKPPTI